MDAGEENVVVSVECEQNRPVVHDDLTAVSWHEDDLAFAVIRRIGIATLRVRKGETFTTVVAIPAVPALAATRRVPAVIHVPGMAARNMVPVRLGVCGHVRGVGHSEVSD
jgi:hypothetical protein